MLKIKQYSVWVFVFGLCLMAGDLREFRPAESEAGVFLPHSAAGHVMHRYRTLTASDRIAFDPRLGGMSSHTDHMARLNQSLDFTVLSKRISPFTQLPDYAWRLAPFDSRIKTLQGFHGQSRCMRAFCADAQGHSITFRFEMRSRAGLRVSRPALSLRRAYGTDRQSHTPASIKHNTRRDNAISNGADQRPIYNVFRSVVIPVGKLPGFSQWQRIAPRVLNASSDICSGMSCNTAAGARMARAASHARRLSPVEALQFINREVNRAISYRSDRSDHWSSLAESAARGVGDCEDYAIAKMTLLRRVGFRQEQLQFIVLKDTRRSMYHAVLVVHVDGQRYVLDNLSNHAAPDKVFRSYVPIASFIGNRHYLHGFVGRRSVVASLGKGGFASIRLGDRS